MDSKLTQLLRTAVKKTDANSLVWSEFTPTAFRAKIGPGYIHIRKTFLTTPEDGEDFSTPSILVQVSDEAGRVVFEEERTESHSRDDYSLLESVFKVARASALGGYHILDNMLMELEREDIPI